LKRDRPEKEEVRRMQDALDALVGSIGLVQNGKEGWTGQPIDLGWGRLYGGQLIAQAADAAWRTVPTGRPLRSLHSFFLRLGSLRHPVHYKVETLREGRELSHRRVEASQQGNRIFHLTASFSAMEEGLSHQSGMPEAPRPEACRSEAEMLQEFVGQLAPRLRRRLPRGLGRRIEEEQPIELRPVSPANFLLPSKGEPRRSMWMRCRGTLPEDSPLHSLLLLYASDFPLIGTALQPHGTNTLSPLVRVASLDHSTWFHAPFRFDEWLLFQTHSPRAAGGRALVNGQFFDTEGRLVSTCSQEGLARPRKR
jgi:acyl-CoA thioesterase II